MCVRNDAHFLRQGQMVVTAPPTFSNYFVFSKYIQTIKILQESLNFNRRSAFQIEKKPLKYISVKIDVQKT